MAIVWYLASPVTGSADTISELSDVVPIGSKFKSFPQEGPIYWTRSNKLRNWYELKGNVGDAQVLDKWFGIDYESTSADKAVTEIDAPWVTGLSFEDERCKYQISYYRDGTYEIELTVHPSQ
ncbi:MAG: hypothetical protein CMJ46_10370 [Planctomyces sp.]|nr:hypothetical protein [Planctomyces sp.]